jgi:uncharacterized membrane protein
MPITQRRFCPQTNGHWLDAHGANAQSIPYHRQVTHNTVSRFIRAGLITGIVDGLFSSVLVVAFYESTVIRLWQGVASVLLGKEALDGGTKTALIGVAMHFAVAFFWSGVFLLVFMRSHWLQRVAQTLNGRVATAALYGPLIWMVMSIVVIPLLVHRPPTINIRWWIQFFGHIPFVALPIVMSIARPATR